MNTRLQVEHPVTEMITGLDLVELMIRIAAGEKLAFAQEDVRLTAAAIEARIYAEDPFRNFLPSIGRLVRYLPPEGDGVRVDTGVYEGARDRDLLRPDDRQARDLRARRAKRRSTRMADALDAFYISGLSHNLPFLAAVVRNPRFRAGALSTNFIAEEYPAGFSGAPIAPEEAQRAYAVAAAAQRIIAERDMGQAGRRGMGGLPRRERHPVRVTRAGAELVVAGDGAARRVATAWHPGQPLMRATVDGVPGIYQIARDGIGFALSQRDGASNSRFCRRALPNCWRGCRKKPGRICRTSCSRRCRDCSSRSRSRRARR